MKEVLLDVNFANYIFIVCDTTNLLFCIQTSWMAAKFYAEMRKIKVKDKSHVCCKMTSFHRGRLQFVS